MYRDFKAQRELMIVAGSYFNKEKKQCEDHTVAGSAVLKGSRQILQASSKTSSFSPEEYAVETNGFSKEDEEKLRFDILGL